MKMMVMMSVLACAASVFADEELVKRWSFRAGYTWRSQAETSFKGGPTPVTGVYADGFVDGDGNWSGENFGTLPSDMGPGSKGGGEDWALVLTRSEAGASGSDEEGLHGLNLSAAYVFYEEPDVFDLSARIRFAGYWNLGNAKTGGSSLYQDFARFLMVPGAQPDPIYDYAEPVDPSDRRYLAGGAVQRIRYEADLYQIGFGPEFTWHALSWFDVYAGAEVLCNFIDADLDTGGASKSETDCVWGVGGYMGITGWFSENIGVYGRVGYEWIDESAISTHGVRAETDFSSLVLSAGLQVAF